MAAIHVSGVGLLPAGEHWRLGLRELVREAGRLALADAGQPVPDLVVVGSAFSAALSGQANVAVLAAGALGLTGVEAVHVAAGDASGASALRTAEMALRAGAARCALVVGVEKMTDLLRDGVEAARSKAMDAELDAAMGIGPTAAAGLMLSRYLHEFTVEREDFGAFARLAHANAVSAKHAYLRRPIGDEEYRQSPSLGGPLRVLDLAPDVDGAAALVLESAPRRSGVTLKASAVATAPLALGRRAELTRLDAAASATAQALDAAERSVKDVGFFELDDSASILAALSLEAVGLADRGHAPRAAAAGAFARDGRLPIATFGGSKARGNPSGASGLYRVAEAALQLRGDAGDNQVLNPRVGLVQSLGSLGAIAITHVLE